MVSIEQSFYEATKLEISSRWRIKNLVKNARSTNTFFKKDVVEFTWFMDSKNTVKLTYTVPVRFLTNSQLTYLQSLVIKK